MRKPIVNIADIELPPRPAGYAAPGAAAARFDGRMGEIATLIGAQKLGYNLTAIPPGKRAFPFHNHRVNEEMFFILEGTGEVRIGTQTHSVRVGDVIACPPGGTETAHQFINTGDTDLKFLAVSTMLNPEICEYPDSGKFVVSESQRDADGTSRGLSSYRARRIGPRLLGWRMMFSRVLIANRGEIACRIMRTCRRLGIQTVAVYSEADATAQHVRLADFAYPIGGPRPADSYLRGEAIVQIAKDSGAQAIHPGYGFLSENADFAEAVASAGIAFIGPSAASMRKMGSKAGAKELMASHGVPVVPGYTGEDQDPALLAREARAHRLPADDQGSLRWRRQRHAHRA